MLLLASHMLVQVPCNDHTLRNKIKHPSNINFSLLYVHLVRDKVAKWLVNVGLQIKRFGPGQGYQAVFLEKALY